MEEAPSDNVGVTPTSISSHVEEAPSDNVPAVGVTPTSISSHVEEAPSDNTASSLAPLQPQAPLQPSKDNIMDPLIGGDGSANISFELTQQNPGN